MRLIDQLIKIIDDNKTLNLKFVCSSSKVSYDTVRRGISGADVKESTLLKIAEFLEVKFILVNEGFKQVEFSQDEKIINYFNKNTKIKASTDDIYNLLFSNSTTPKTSIGRSLTNLSKTNGPLKKSRSKKIGALGRPVICWELKNKNGKG